MLVIALQDDEATARELLGPSGLPVLMDDSGEIAAAYRISAVPTHVFVDATGGRPTPVVGAVSAEDALARLDAMK